MENSDIKEFEQYLEEKKKIFEELKKKLQQSFKKIVQNSDLKQKEELDNLKNIKEFLKTSRDALENDDQDYPEEYKQKYLDEQDDIEKEVSRTEKMLEKLINITKENKKSFENDNEDIDLIENQSTLIEYLNNEREKKFQTIMLNDILNKEWKVESIYTGWQVECVTETAKMPQKGTTGSVGYDLYSDEDNIIPPLSRNLISTGLKMKFPNMTYGRLCPRSGMSVKGIDIGAGIIDPDYSGIIFVLLINSTNKEYIVNKGDRICQIIISPYDNSIPTKTTNIISDTERNDSGFGSTGI